MFFFPIKTSHLLYKVFYHQIKKKKKNYLSHTGKDINHTNDIDASNALCCANPIALRLKNIPTVAVATMVMNSPSSPIGSSEVTVGHSSMFS